MNKKISRSKSKPLVAAKKASRKNTSENSPPKRNSEMTKERLLCAAIEVFSKHGYDGATTRLIASVAGANESLIIRYFNGKEGLLHGIIRRFLDEKMSQNDLSYPEQSTLEDELIQFATASFDMNQRDPNLFRAVVSRAAVDEKIRKMIRAQIPHEGDPRLHKRLQKLQDKGEIPKGVSVREIQHAIGTQVFALSLTDCMILDASRESTLESLKHFVRIYARGIKATSKK